MITARSPRYSSVITSRSGERGFTLMETMMALSIAGMLLVPLLGWSLLAGKEQVNTMIRNTDGTSVGLLRSQFVKDVASSYRGYAGSNAAGTDCNGGDGQAQSDEDTVLRLRRDDDTSVIYTVAASQLAPGDDAIWRRVCDGMTLDEESELVSQVAAGGVSTDCQPRDGASNPSECGRITLRSTFTSGRQLSMNASLRAGMAAGLTGGSGFDYVSPDVILDITKPSVVYRGDTVTFDASASIDPTGGTLTYHWQFGDGATADTAVATHSYDSLGTFTALLTVTNGDGTPMSDFTRITVDNRLPVTTVSQPSGDVTSYQCTNVAFAAHGSNDDGDTPYGGAVTTYEWDYGDGTTGTRTSPAPHNKQYIEPSPDGAPYVAKLKVVDNDGGDGEPVTRNVTIVNRPPNTPSITATVNGTTVGVGQSVMATKPVSVSLNATASDPDGSCDTLTYQWKTTAGSTIGTSDQTTSHTFTSGTSVKIYVVVSDEHGATAQSGTITINMNTNPVASFALSPSEVFTGQNVTLTSSSTDDETPISGLTHAWTFPNGSPATSNANPTVSNVKFNANVASGSFFDFADYSVSLKVTDPQGGENTTTKTVRVKGARPPTSISSSGRTWKCGLFSLGTCRENTLTWSAVSQAASYDVEMAKRHGLFGAYWWDGWTRVATSSPETSIFFADGNGWNNSYLRVRIRSWDAYAGTYGNWSDPAQELDFK